MVRNLTIRRGTKETYWYYLAGYLAIATLGIVYTVWTFLRAPAASTAFGAGIFLAFLALGSVVTFPTLFLDSAYIRGARYRWKPRWWLYLGVGSITPIVVYFVVKTAFSSDAGVAGLALALLLSTYAMSAVYLYNRHDKVGVP